MFGTAPAPWWAPTHRREFMKGNVGEPQRQNFGEVVAAACDLGSAVAPDRVTAMWLATRHVERVLVRTGNARIFAALAEVAVLKAHRQAS